MARKHQNHSDLSAKNNLPDILFCGHSVWEESDGYTTIPAYTFLHMYAPLGASLSQSIVRALAAGERIQKKDLQSRPVSPLTLFNYNYAPQANVQNYEQKILEDYPVCLGPGDKVPNFRMFNPGKDGLQTHHESIEVINIEGNPVYLSELLEKFQGEICHFGGCSWVSSNFQERNIVTFANAFLNEKYKDPELTEEEKRQQREARFR